MSVAQANEEARKLRRETERQISELLEDYQSRTGLEVDSIDIQPAPHGRPLGKRVRIEARL
jgi:hypothetical protein